jgi:FKBP-type peptidyl-prolyl cis-trans isomerase
MPPPKTTLDKIVVAVTTLADPTGSSRQAIVKFLKSEFQLDNANAIKKALKQGVDKGKLTQKGQSFSLPGVEFEVPKDEQVTIEEVRVGEGDLAERGSDVTMKYRGTLESDGSEFDSASRFDFTLGAGEVIKGWDKGIEGMRVGGKRKLVIPPKLGYGKRGSPPEIPGDATLVFDVELLAVN